MAQVVYSAANYPLGTSLEDLGFVRLSASTFTAEHVVGEITAGGTKYFEAVEGASGISATGNQTFTFDPATDEVDILVVCNFTMTDLSHASGFKVQFDGASGATAAFTIDGSDVITQTEWVIPGTFSTTGSNAIATDIPTTGKAFAARYHYNSTTQEAKVRYWGAAVDGLEAAEPAIWHLTGTTSSSLTPRILMSIQSSSGDFSSLSYGTDGDLATFPSLTEVVTTPTNLTVSNVTDTTADVDWT